MCNVTVVHFYRKRIKLGKEEWKLWNRYSTGNSEFGGHLERESKKKLERFPALRKQWFCSRSSKVHRKEELTIDWMSLSSVKHEWGEVIATRFINIDMKMMNCNQNNSSCLLKTQSNSFLVMPLLTSPCTKCPTAGTVYTDFMHVCLWKL